MGWGTQPLRIQLVTAHGVCLLLFTAYGICLLLFTAYGVCLLLLIMPPELHSVSLRFFAQVLAFRRQSL